MSKNDFKLFEENKTKKQISLCLKMRTGDVCLD